MGNPQRVLLRPVRIPVTGGGRHRWQPFERTVMDEIVTVVRARSLVSLELMRSDSRGLAETNARMIATAIAVTLYPKWNPQHIADYFQRDVSYVHCAKKRVSNALKHHSHCSLRREALRICDEMGLLPSQLICKP